MESAAGLSKRQNYSDADYEDSWWWSDTGVAIRYTVTIAILALVLLYFVGGYFDARRRLKKGLPLKRYHRWMVRRQNRQQQHNTPQYNPYYQDPNQQGYPMQPYPNNAAPPAYNTHAPPPPAYAPPEGASKAMADQTYTREQFGQAGGPSGYVPPVRQ